MKIICYCDGSSSGMRKGQTPIAGWAMCIPNLNGKQYIRYGHIPNGTNGMGELTGPYYLLERFHKMKNWEIEIISDAQYFIKSVTTWRKNWKAIEYEGVKNLEFLLPIFDWYDKHGNIKLTWVKGHSGNIGNEMADGYAGKGKRQIIENIKNDEKDIEYVPYKNMSCLQGDKFNVRREDSEEERHNVC